MCRRPGTPRTEATVYPLPCSRLNGDRVDVLLCTPLLVWCCAHPTKFEREVSRQNTQEINADNQCQWKWKWKSLNGQ